MASIKAIEGRSVHQIQSGQVIVDLCSVVKELVENSLDAGATSIDVRFKNNGLESIEVQDNGSGVAPEDFANIARKHYTSKLSSYDDLTALQTFGFRGEALSSLCALSKFHIITARASDGPKGTRLEFEASGELKDTSVVATTRGTTVSVEDIFFNLPVRKRELSKNIKREYGKVLNLLHAYACISTGVRFSVSNHMPKGKKVVAFSTKSNATTKENIANVYGAKMLASLVPLELKFEMQPTYGPGHTSKKIFDQASDSSREVKIEGHISRPVVGEGRHTPDRQMFFVNSRPCGLPQIAKAFNEVYKSFNVTQSPFIFADLKLDTGAYDVNVSPDKRTILLHDQLVLLDSLKTSLAALFEAHDQSVPQSQLISAKKTNPFRALTLIHEVSSPSSTNDAEPSSGPREDSSSRGSPLKVADANEVIVPQIVGGELQRASHFITALEHLENDPIDSNVVSMSSKPDEKKRNSSLFVQDDDSETSDTEPRPTTNAHVSEEEEVPAIGRSRKSSPGPVQNAFDRMRPKRFPAESATITIGGRTTTSVLGNTPNKRRRVHTPKNGLADPFANLSPLLSRRLGAFAAPGSQLENSDVSASEAEDNDDDTADLSATDSDGQSEKQSSYQSSSEASNDRSRSPDSPSSEQVADKVDSVYVNEEEKKVLEDEKVARMIADAEKAAAKPNEDNMKRAQRVMRGPVKRFSTLLLEQTIDTTALDFTTVMEEISSRWKDGITPHRSSAEDSSRSNHDTPANEEEELSLTISKSDFARMRIVGQFNLGFVLAIRPGSKDSQEDQLFIIDQHASDEKYNFERLQKSTILTPQRLVHPHPLSLTAIEEEIIINHRDSLTANGFFVDVDLSGEVNVGNRCSLLTLPTSREVTFTPRDLEELIVLLSEHVGNGIPRPAKVRKLLAMRACRGSVMIGKTLTPGMMEKIVRHLGEMDKPWNCPHGRPTMRHLYGLDAWPTSHWNEGDGLAGLGESSPTNWAQFLQSKT